MAAGSGTVTLVCTRHGTRLDVDLDHRAIFHRMAEQSHITGNRARPPGGCGLLRQAAIALDQGPDAVLGDWGPWDPRTRASLCHFETEGEP